MKVVRKETGWVISNALANEKEHIKMALDSGLIKLLVSSMAIEDLDIQVEILHALSNATSTADLEQIGIFVFRYHFLELFIEKLEFENPDILIMALKGILNILTAGDLLKTETNPVNQFVARVEDVSGTKALEALQHHESTEVYNLVYGLIEKFFLVDANQQEQPRTINDKN